jgi:hypothetical protein
MIDVDYAGSPLVVDHAASSATADGPRPGKRYLDWARVAATSHHALVFGDADAAELERFERRWSRLVRISLEPAVDPARAGVPSGGTILVRPDGHIGFRFPSTGADALAALDRHLSSYLIAEGSAHA